MKKIFFASNLALLRKKVGVKSSEMLENIGFKRTTWSGYENGKSFPKLEDFLKIVEFFDIGADDILFSDLSNVHLNYNQSASKKAKNVHLNVHPNVHLNDKNDGNKRSLTADQTAFEMLEKVLKTQEKTIASQEAMIQLQANKIAELEEIKRRLESEIPEIGKPVEHKKREAG